MKNVLKYLKPYLPITIVCVTLKTLSAFTELAIPSKLEVIIDSDVPSGNIGRVLQSGAVMLLFAFLTFILNVIGNRVSAVATGKFARDLRADLFKKAIYLESKATDRIGISSIISRLTSDTYVITSFLARLQRIGLKAPLSLIGGIIITLTIDARLALILIGILPFVCITVLTITRKTVKIYKEEQNILDGIVRKVDETAAGIRVIKALSKTEYESLKFKKKSDSLAEKEMQAGALMSATKPITDLLLNLGLCLIILVGALLTGVYGTNSSGKLLTFMTYFTVILNNMIMITRVYVQLSKSVASMARINELLSVKDELFIEESTEALKDDTPYIEFKNVSFSYNGRVDNLKNISFTLKRGQTLGIIGSTGSGKTTVINLLLRLYDPDSGEILINGKNIKSIPTSELYSKFGVAFQNDFVPEGTVAENVAFFRDIALDKIDEALDIAQAKEYVFTMQNGKDSHITTRGTNISGGQKQRLLISRAVAAEPDILILDDAAGALDYKTDMLLRRAIKSKISSTTVIIAQRISSVKSSDKILVIEDGELIGQGTHEHLMAAVPEYRAIAEVQMGA